MTTPAAEPRTEAGRRLLAYELGTGADGVIAEQAMNELLGRHWEQRDAILAIEREARAAFAREVRERFDREMPDSFYGDPFAPLTMFTREHIYRLLDAEVPQEEQG